MPPAPASASVFLAYAARGRNDWWRFLVATVLALLIAMALGIVFTLAAWLAGLPPAEVAVIVQKPSQPVGFYLANGALFGCMLLGFVAAIGLLHRKRFGDLLGAWSWRDYGLGLAIWAAVLVFAGLIDFALAPGSFSFTATQATPALVAAAVVGLGVQTFAEEVVFRGYLTQGLLLATKRPLVASLISGLIFGAMHIPNGAPQAANAAVFGVVLALIAIRTGGLAFTSGLHLVNNVFGAAVVVSANDAFRGSPGLFTQDTPHLMWWDAAFGAASLVVLAIVMMRRPARSQS